MKLIPPKKDDPWGKIGLRAETDWEQQLLDDIANECKIDDHGVVLVISRKITKREPSNYEPYVYSHPLTTSE